MSLEISERKLAANRANAQKSTGPKTDKGKRRSSQNARTHSLTAFSIPILDCDRRRFLQLQQEYRDHFRPLNAIEADTVDRIILARWHDAQAERLLQGYWDLAHCPGLPEPKGRLTERHRCRRLVQFIMKDCGSNILTRIMRYKEAARRDAVAYQKILFQLQNAGAPAECETKPKKETLEPLTNPFYRQDFYRQLERDAKKLPPACEDPSLPRNRPPNALPAGPSTLDTRSTV